MKKILLTLATALFATTAFGQLNYSDAFPADFSKGLPTGWNIDHDATVETVENGLKVTCTQEKPKYRADLKYNFLNPNTNLQENYFNIDADKYRVFAIKFIGTRPISGNIQLSLIVLDNNVRITGTSDEYSITKGPGTNQYAGDLEDADGNHTYYWIIGGNKWTGTQTVHQIEMKIADITDEKDKTYTISEINWYESEETLKSTITEKSVVENKTTSLKYSDFKTAYEAAVNNDNLLLLSDVELTQRFAMKSITIEGKTGIEKIIQNNNNYILFNTGTNSNMTFRNIIFESISGPGDKVLLEHNANSKDSHTLTLDKVTLNGISSSNANGLFNIKKGCLVLKDVKFNNCSASKLAGFVKIGASDNCLSLSGANEGLKVYVSAYNSISANELSNETPIELTLADTMLPTVANESITRADEAVNAIVTGCNDASKFKLTNEGYKLVCDGKGNLVLAQDTSSAVEAIVVDNSNAPVEYYNLQGVKVTNPEKGIYIMRQGTSVRKVIL